QRKLNRTQWAVQYSANQSKLRLDCSDEGQVARESLAAKVSASGCPAGTACSGLAQGNWLVPHHRPGPKRPPPQPQLPDCSDKVLIPAPLLVFRRMRSQKPLPAGQQSPATLPPSLCCRHELQNL